MYVEPLLIKKPDRLNDLAFLLFTHPSFKVQGRFYL